MACRGVHFALSDEDVATLLSKESDEDRLIAISDDIEDRYFEEPANYMAETDKSWDAMHRAFSGGYLRPNQGAYPLDHVVLGGRSLYGGDDYIIILKTPSQVKDVAAALAEVTESAFRARYDVIDPLDYDEDLSDEDFEYTWSWLQGVRSLFQRAAAESRHVLFTVDQ